MSPEPSLRTINEPSLETREDLFGEKTVVASKAKKSENNGSKQKADLQGSRLKPDWVLSDEWVDDATALGVRLDTIRNEADKFRDYWTAKPGKDGVKLDWRATWRNWIRRCAENQKPGDMIPTSRPRGQQWGEVVR